MGRVSFPTQKTIFQIQRVITPERFKVPFCGLEYPIVFEQMFRPYTLAV